MAVPPGLARAAGDGGRDSALHSAPWSDPRPGGHARLVLPRSGLAARHGIALVNAPGLIDAGYRGELRVLLLNTDRRDHFEVAAGDRIAQLVLIRVEQAALEEVPELDETGRGIGGFGSSGR